MRGPSNLLILSLMGAALVASGCVGGSDAPASDGQMEETTDDELGTVQGVVTDTEGLPIPGVLLALTPGDREATSLANGSFRFVNVEPGEYSLIVQKLGYESFASRVTVAANQVATKDVQLAALAVLESYHYTLSHRGELTCAMSLSDPVGVISWVSPCDYPYTAVYYTLLGHGVNLTNYGLPAEPLANDWRWNTEIEANTSGVVSELLWEPVSDASDAMMLAVSCPEYDPVFDDCGRWGTNGAGPAPLVQVRWEMPKDETVFMTRVYLPWFQDPVQFALNQKYEVFHTMFFGEKPPEEFSVVPPELRGG